MRRSRRVVIATAVALAASTAVAVGVTTAGTQASKPIIIGAAIDLTGNMAPFDGPALTAAQIEAKRIAASGGPNFQIRVCDHQGKNQKACAAQLIGGGAKIAIVTCDVEIAAPSVQEFINKGMLTVAPCVTTDQMGPQRFGKKGRLAFTIGSTAQDEGSAEAEYAYALGLRTSIVVKDNLLVYFKEVSDAFAKRFQELGGKIVDREAFTSGDKTIGNVISKVGQTKADVISFVTAFGELPQFVSGLRSLGNNTPILNSWGGEGVYWNPQNPKVTNYYADSYASAFGDDPDPSVNRLVKAMTALKKTPATGGFVLGAAAIDAIAAAVERNGGSTNGLKLASTFETFHRLQTASGPITYSKTLHSVVGRPWRIMQIQNNKETYLRMWKTKKVVTLP